MYLEEILDAFRVIAVTLPADPLNLFDLSGLTGRLDVFEMYVPILTEVDDGSQEIKQS